ncbi:MAG: class I SAM-dependent methyltransferase [Bdellovibrionales bacterium]|nr:class I SAM-dependent methyltransferase [Bdellovibrionales bacterium]
MGAEIEEREVPLDQHGHDQHGQLLDSIYSFQRHIYDVTRKYYLFGRDTVINRLVQTHPKNVLEIGCGTGRNLFLIERKLSSCALYGLDASKEMLKHAISKAPKSSKISFQFGYAESFSPQQLFSEERFSAVLFSYSLSMIPDSIGALTHSIELLEPNGTIWIVDFWDQGGYPKWFQTALQYWLALFHVKFEPALLQHIQKLESAHNGTLSVMIEPIGRRYGYLARITKNQ